MRVLFIIFCCVIAVATCWRVGPPPMTRRQAMIGMVSVLPLAATAAEPEPAKIPTEEEMAARVARKAALLKQQSLKGKTDAKVLFGADYQMGKREAGGSTKSSSSPAGVAGFLLPGDVGGLNLGNPFAGSTAPEKR